MKEKSCVLEGEPNSAAEHRAVLVETEGFQCMAFQDCHGKWRSFYDLKLLPGKVEVITSE